MSDLKLPALPPMTYAAKWGFDTEGQFTYGHSVFYVWWLAEKQRLPELLVVTACAIRASTAWRREMLKKRRDLESATECMRAWISFEAEILKRMEEPK